MLEAMCAAAFEPPHDAYLKLVSYKIAFSLTLVTVLHLKIALLLTLVTAKRVGELPVLAACTHFAEG